MIQPPNLIPNATPAHGSGHKFSGGDLTDELEDLILRKKSVNFKIRSEHGPSWKVGQVVDLFAKDHEDYMKLADGTVVAVHSVMEWTV